MPDEVITQEVLDRFGKLTSATVFSGVRRLGYLPCWMQGVKAMTPGARLVGRAETLRFVPPRPDIRQETARGEDSPEYQAMGSCGPGDVVVMDAMGKHWASIGGDVKFLQLKMVGAEGLVTDGAIRDLDAVRAYGMKLFAGGRTGAVGEPDVWPYEANVTIQCGGVAVRPGDLIFGDDDGLVVVPRPVIKEVLEWSEEHEAVEEYVKGLIQAENVAPGKYYPITDETIKKYHQSRRG